MIGLIATVLRATGLTATGLTATGLTATGLSATMMMSGSVRVQPVHVTGPTVLRNRDNSGVHSTW